MGFLKNLLENKLFINVLVIVATIFLLQLACPNEVEQIVDTVHQVDTLFVEGPTVYLDKIVYQEVEPDTLYITEYVEAPVTVSMVSAVIDDGDNLYLEYLVNDEFHSVTMDIELPQYGDTHVTVDPDTGIVVHTQRIGWHPELIGGVSFRGVYAGVDLWYWNDFLIFEAAHFPTVTAEYTIFEEKYEVIPKVGGSVDLSDRSPLRFGAQATWEDGGVGFSAGAEIPLYELKE